MCASASPLCLRSGSQTIMIVFAGRTPLTMGRRPKAFGIGFLKTIMLGPLYSHLSQLFTPVPGPGHFCQKTVHLFGTSPLAARGRTGARRSVLTCETSRHCHVVRCRLPFPRHCRRRTELTHRPDVPRRPRSNRGPRSTTRRSTSVAAHRTSQPSTSRLVK